MGYEHARVELRELVKFIEDDGNSKKIIYTDLVDEPISNVVGIDIEQPLISENYRLKVNRYIEEHKNDTAIWKLRNNEKLNSDDYEVLLAIFTQELGNKEDYEKEFGETPLGLLVRKIAKLEREAAMRAFSEFINDQSLNQEQIVFINKVVDYVVENGYFEDVGELLEAPFDRPKRMMDLFSMEEKVKIIEVVKAIKQNALVA